MNGPSAPPMAAIIPRREDLPEELTARPNWVAWRVEVRDGKPTKVPVDPHTGHNARANDPTTWGTFGQAVARCQRDKLAGIGYEFAEDENVVGVDFDHVIDPTTGEWQAWAFDAICALDSYSELSPSGHGIHVFVDAKLLRGYKTAGLEIYPSGRFFTMTGQRLPNAPRTVEPRQPQLEALITEHFPEQNDRAASIPEKIPHGTQHNTLVSAAGTMRRRGMTVDEIDAALQIMNAQRCERPGPPENIRAIAESVCKYPPAGELTIGGHMVGEASPNGRPRVWTHADLMRANFPERKWVIEGLVPDASLVMVAGKKKIGKSWLCLQAAVAVASGKALMGRKVTQGPVVYCCLEDSVERVRERLAKQRAPEELPITYVERLKHLDDGGMPELVDQIEASHPVLVIVDTLAAAKSGRIDENAAGAMADMMNYLRQIAQEYKVAILVVAHHGKASYGDPGDDIRGSSAIAAAADLNVGLYRTENAHLLKAEGRDIEPIELRIEFDAARTWCWCLVGDARKIAREETDQDVLEALTVLEEGDAGAIAREAGRERSTVQKVLRRLRLAGKVTHRAEKSGRTTKVLYRVAK